MTIWLGDDSMMRIAIDIKKQIHINDYYYAIIKTTHSLTSGLYAADDDKIEYLNETCSLSRSFSQRLGSNTIKNGVWIIQCNTDEIKHITDYNPELFKHDLLELVLFQEFAKIPKKAERQNTLKESIKKEKIKKTLVHSCYIDDRKEILHRVKTASTTQLNKKLQYTGTPLGLCAENDFLEGFKAIVEAGADLTKNSLAGTPLEIAFKFSPDITWYLIHNHKELFENSLKKHGFSLVLSTQDKQLLQLILDSDCDILGKDLHFPTLHSFADFNNLVGIQFALDNGFDINFKNKRKQTALDRAKIHGHKELIEFLSARGAE